MSQSQSGIISMTSGELESRYLTVDGLSTHYVDVGEGPTVVLLHGAALAVDMMATWSPVIPALKEDFRVVAFDQIGFGLSAMPPSGRLENRLGRIAHALRFLDELGVRRAAFIGHSEGAFMAARIAVERQDLAAGIVAVTSGGLSPRIGGPADEAWMAASKAAYVLGAEAEAEDSYLQQIAPLAHRKHPKLEARLRENYRRPSTKQQLQMFRDVDRHEGYVEDYLSLQSKYVFPYADKLPPTLIAWASSDPTVPMERAIALQKILKNADLHIFANASHMVMYDREAEFNSVIRNWLLGVFQAA